VTSAQTQRSLERERLGRYPTVAELRAMSDAELVERHDALVARSRETGDPVSGIYLGELGARMVRLRVEQAVRIALAALLASAVAVIVGLAVAIVAL
jgi:hypothetical protein